SGRQLQGTGTPPRWSIGSRDEAGGAQAGQYILQRLPGHEAQPRQFRCRRIGMIGERAQNGVLRHRNTGRAQRVVSPASQRLLDTLDEVTDRALSFRQTHVRNLTSVLWL